MEVNINRTFKDLFKSSFFFKLDKFCDATITSDDGSEFRAHKLLLSKRSEYFNTFFQTDVGEQRDVAVLPFETSVLETVLIYLYTGKIDLDSENIVSVILAADYLLIDSLLMLCKYVSVSKVSLNNCMSLLAVSYDVQRIGIMDYCYRYVQIHFEVLVDNYSSGISNLPFRVLIKLLKDDGLGITVETTVWKAIVCWVTGHAADRLKNVPELLSCIRWNDVDPILATSIRLHPIIQENSFCKRAGVEEMNKTLKIESLETDAFSLPSNRCPRKMYVCIWRKHFPYPSGTEIFLTYDEQLDVWRKIGEIDINFHTFVTTNQYVFMFNTISNEMRTFDLLRKEWVVKNTMRAQRQGYFVVRSRNRIFAVGGCVFFSSTLVAEVEYYEPAMDVWTYTAPLPPMYVCGASVVNEMLYVVGYPEQPGRPLMKALVYDAVYDAWSEIETPKHFRTNFGIINFNDHLYIFGGKTEDSSLSAAVEAYSPKTGEWEECPELPIFYELPRAVILNDKLTVYDDFPGAASCLWNVETQQWELESASSPFNEIHRYEFCTVDNQSTLRELTAENRGPEAVWVRTPLMN